MAKIHLNKIYTRTGDGGMTGLVGGARRSKAHLRLEAIGAVDEANSIIGLARLHAGKYDTVLKRIQHDLFDLGADLATPSFKPKDLRMVPAQVMRLEKEIDAMNAKLKPLTSFVLPGGMGFSSWLHLARTVVRRAERVACALAKKEKINPDAICYLNRLSDYMFVLARVANDNGKKDILWEPGINR